VDLDLMINSYDWKLKDIKSIPQNNLKVFSMFCGGGGSSMGYKLAGFNCLGGNEIDPRQADLYQINLRPKYIYAEDIKTFNQRLDLPQELYSVDILDGSPPCTVFSLSNSRRAQNRNQVKRFREGQKEQRIDTLFFDFIETVKKLRPRIVVAENVKGMLLGVARNYLLNILKELTAIGYIPQVFLLNSATMGIPQRRERIFIIAYDKKETMPRLKMDFTGRLIPYKEIEHDDGSSYRFGKDTRTYSLWKQCRVGKSFDSITGNSWYDHSKCHPDKILPTIITASYKNNKHYSEPRGLSVTECRRAQTFPMDYDFGKENPFYVLGMAVPPFMLRAISKKILEQWLIPTQVKRATAQSARESTTTGGHTLAKELT
jgi:DNA (cytosine-5)-methyltransferase 1